MDPKPTKEFLFGRHPVFRALSNQRREFLGVYFQQDLPENETLNQIYAIAHQRNIPVQTLQRIELERKFSLSGKAHQGVVAISKPFIYARLDEVMDQQTDHPLFLVVLDHIQDPHNVGALIRTAELAGADAVIIPKDRACEITTTVVKTSAGASEILPIVQVTNLNRTIEALKEKWIQIVGLETGDNTTIYDVDFSGPTALIVGNEGEGIAHLTQQKCDILAEIPMPGKLESLNASVAGAIGMFEVVRQRRNKIK
jgi:23S rRNA (guanosine2251-2'-O)-methyltransferase